MTVRFDKTRIKITLFIATLDEIKDDAKRHGLPPATLVSEIVEDYYNGKPAKRQEPTDGER